jgi:hypothetical protein
MHTHRTHCTPTAHPLHRLKQHQHRPTHEYGNDQGQDSGSIICFSFLRPYYTVVYAPKLRVADQKHAPPPLGKSPWAWLWPLWQTSEQDLVTLVGLDATIFMRFTRMCRNIFLVCTGIGCCILLAVNYSTAQRFDNDTWLTRITPLNVWHNSQWALVAVAWMNNIITCGVLLWNYRKVLHLRRQYYESPEYQQSLHARTLMVCSRLSCSTGYLIPY